MNKALSETVYERLTDVEDARVCAEISAAACRETPGNFVLTLVAQFLTKLADAVASPKLVLAWVLTAIQAPVGLTGLLVPIRESGSLIPQLLIASYVRRLPLRKWAWVVGSVIQAIAIAAIGAVALSLEGAMAGWAIIACLVVFSLARGLCSVAAKDVLGKTIPKSKRGQVAGLSASAAGLVTVALGLVLMYADTGAGTTTLYGGLILTAAALWLLGAMVYSRITEFPGETGGGGNALYEAVKRLGLLRSDRAFRRFVITRALLLCSALLAPYFVVLAQQQHGASPDLLGLFGGVCCPSADRAHCDAVVHAAGVLRAGHRPRRGAGRAQDLCHRPRRRQPAHRLRGRQQQRDRGHPAAGRAHRRDVLGVVGGGNHPVAVVAGDRRRAAGADPAGGGMTAWCRRDTGSGE
jgi:hypothetical protein